MEVILKLAGRDDETFLAALFCEVKAAEFAPLGLPPAMLANMLAMQHKAQTSGYAAQFPAAEDSIVWVDGKRAGRVLVARGASEMHLVDIALRSEFRGFGTGERLLRGLCEEARETKVPLRLSVRAGNPAERLYARLGFRSTGNDGLNRSMEFRAE